MKTISLLIIFLISSLLSESFTSEIPYIDPLVFSNSFKATNKQFITRNSESSEYLITNKINFVKRITYNNTQQEESYTIFIYSIEEEEVDISWKKEEKKKLNKTILETNIPNSFLTETIYEKKSNSPSFKYQPPNLYLSCLKSNYIICITGKGKTSHKIIVHIAQEYLNKIDAI